MQYIFIFVFITTISYFNICRYITNSFIQYVGIDLEVTTEDELILLKMKKMLMLHKKVI